MRPKLLPHLAQLAHRAHWLHRPWALIAAAWLGLAGCASGPLRDPTPDPLLTLTADTLFAPPLHAPDGEQLLALTPAMEQFVQNLLAQPGAQRKRMQLLVEALRHDNELDLRYDAGTTRTAGQAFASGRGNCLSLVAMTGALASRLGLQVRYQIVATDPQFIRYGGLEFAAGHVNIVLGEQVRDLRRLQSPDEHSWTVIDFLPEANASVHRAQAVDGVTLTAMYLNNRAAELLAEGQSDDAYWWARAALQAQRDYAPAINTLAVVYQHAGHAALAERSLRHALLLDPHLVAAWSNLARLLNSQGRVDEARHAALRLAALQPQEPFLHFDRGLQALARGDLDAARQELLTELRLQPTQQEVHFALARTYAALGEAALTEHHLEQAAHNSTTPQAQALYSAKLARLRHTAAAAQPTQ